MCGLMDFFCLHDQCLKDKPLTSLDICLYLHSEHQELSRQIQESRDPKLTEDLERELDHVVSRMESKGEQIARLTRHRETTVSI